MEYAVIKSGGKQYKVSKGDIIEVERLDLKPKDKVVLGEVLMYVSDGATSVGKPIVEGISVKGTVLDNIKGVKIRVSKFKAKSRYRRVTGHRQALTKVQIDEIVSSKKEAKVASKTKSKVNVKKTA